MAARDQPQDFGAYQLLRRIGAGGMGEVFLARRVGEGTDPGQAVVVKKILPHLSEDRGFVGRFEDEGKVVVHLDHPNICRTLEIGEVDGQFFMAMEYVEGKTLAKVQSRLREMNYSFPVELALWVGVQVCGGLEHAHTQTDPHGVPLQVVHRDVSPSNVMVTYDGALKLIDFGAALSTLKEELTAPRVVIGNLSYMAPEHARKQHVDLRADLFSVGVVLWELITWQLIPADGDPIERWRRAARPSFQKPSYYRSDLPRELDAVIMRALAPDPRDRYPSAKAFQAELLALLDRHWPDTDGKKLAAFMRATFGAERDAERAVVSEAMGVAQGLAVTTTVTDPFTPAAALRSDATPQPLPLDTTLPSQPALGGELTDPGGRGATAPATLAAETESGESTLPPLRVPTREVLARSDPSARPMQRTPTRLARPLPPYVWAAIGVGLGFGLVALVVAFSR